MNSHTVESPCINTCKIDQVTQRCTGCDRTIDEITRWSRMDNDAKQAVIDNLVLRKVLRNQSQHPSSNTSPTSDGSPTQQTPITPGKPSRSDKTAPGIPGSRSAGCE